MRRNSALPFGADTIFFGLQAYLTISLDAAGLFRFLAFWVANKGGSSGKRLYLYFWVFFLLLAVAVGNVSSVFSPLFRTHPSSRTLSFSPVPPSLRISPGSQGMYCMQSGRRRESLLMLDPQHIPPNSLDIYAILCCKHGYARNSFAREYVTEFD